ncbi:dTDP-glucose 4,6-dehydratase [bacterium]|nr:dTDP-glucose 4,6-dehydratase [bacterium]|tara:strand:- start:890 stop:1903 length:1014 start_codon:yes stop_codon:yes gene_type:complete
MKLLITGGAGFIGSNFIRYILKKYPDYKIINLDKLTYAGNLANLLDIEEKCGSRHLFIKGDICNVKLVDMIMPKVDAVINFAAESHVDKSILDAQAFIKTDILGTQTLLESVKAHKIKRYIQISTDEVYGEIKNGSSKEIDALKPRNPYSASKAGGDLLCQAYFNTYNLPVMITRGANNFGPYQYPEKLIPLFITNLLEDKTVPVYGDGKQIREWIFVVDHCSGIDKVLHGGKVGEIYNIGTGVLKQNIKITKLILKELGKSLAYIEYVKDRPGHDRRYSLDSSKIRALGWKPKYEFKNALQKTIKWYLRNHKWWERLKSGEYLEYYKNLLASLAKP